MVMYRVDGSISEFLWVFDVGGHSILVFAWRMGGVGFFRSPGAGAAFRFL